MFKYPGAPAAGALIALLLGLGLSAPAAHAAGVPAPEIVAPEASAPVTSDPQVTFSGTGTAGDDVTIVRQDAHSVTICATQPVGDDGFWSCTAEVADGTTAVVAHEVTPDGSAEAFSSPVVLRIDTHAPRKPRILNPTNGALTRTVHVQIVGTAEAGSQLVVNRAGHPDECELTVPASRTWSCIVTVTHPGEEVAFAVATDAAGNASEAGMVDWFVDPFAPARPTITRPTSHHAVHTRRPTFSGRAGLFTTVVVRQGGTVLCTARPHAVVAGRAAAWSCTSRIRLRYGHHRVVAIQVDRSGHGVTSAPASFVIRRK